MTSPNNPVNFSNCGIDTLKEMLGQDAWFGGIPSELQEALLAHARVSNLKTGEMLYRRNDKPLHALFCVLQGGICITNATETGAETLVVYLEPFHWFGDVALIDGLPRQQDAVSDGNTSILCVALQPFSDWLDRHPKYWREIARLSAGKLRVAYQVIAEPGNLHQRLARRLWWMAHGFGSRLQAPTPHIKISQGKLAQMMGASRQSTNAALQELEKIGVIRLHYRAIEIKQFSQLLRHADLV